MTDEKDIIQDEERILAQRKKAARRAKAQNRTEEEVSGLNINSMMDMMVIILVFLLKQYGSEPIQINQSDDLRLPYSSSSLAPEDMLTMTVTKRWIMVEDEQVVPITNGAIDPAALQSADSAIIPELQQRVEEVLRTQEEWARMVERPFERVVTIISDESTPYRVLTQVMITATAGGVQNFKFAILQREQGAGVRAGL